MCVLFVYVYVCNMSICPELESGRFLCSRNSIYCIRHGSVFILRIPLSFSTNVLVPASWTNVHEVKKSGKVETSLDLAE